MSLTRNVRSLQLMSPQTMELLERLTGGRDASWARRGTGANVVMADVRGAGHCTSLRKNQDRRNRGIAKGQRQRPAIWNLTEPVVSRKDELGLAVLECAPWRRVDLYAAPPSSYCCSQLKHAKGAVGENLSEGASSFFSFLPSSHDLED